MVGKDIKIIGNNLKNLEEYRIKEKIYDNYYKMNDKDINRLLSIYTFFNERINVKNIYFSYYYYKEYIQIEINRIEDDYYYIYIFYKKNSIDYNDYYYKVDQFSGLLKFLRILFRGVEL